MQLIPHTEAAPSPRKPRVRRATAILALDLGTKTGWALAKASQIVASGTSEFRPGRFEGAGMSFLRFDRWLDDLLDNTGAIDLVAFEEVRAHVGTLAAQVYGGFLAHLTAWCESNAVPYRGVPVATIKRYVTGKGNAPKDAVTAAVRARGYDPRDDNEADAIALALFALKTWGEE
jgi:crossover junction endodeoxyribonuclease RuvC